jgi:hypothetical protein
MKTRDAEGSGRKTSVMGFCTMQSGTYELGRRQFRLVCFMAWVGAACLSMASPALGQPIEVLLGSWSGQGQVFFKGATKENIKCKAYNVIRNLELRLVIRCASAGRRIEIRSKLKMQGTKVSGHWEERTYNATGEVKGRIGDGALALTITGGGLNGAMYVSYDRSTMTVSITAKGINMQAVHVTLARMKVGSLSQFN